MNNSLVLISLKPQAFWIDWKYGIGAPAKSGSLALQNLTGDRAVALKAT